jgi:hypothetical protein
MTIPVGLKDVQAPFFLIDAKYIGPAAVILDDPALADPRRNRNRPRLDDDRERFLREQADPRKKQTKTQEPPG